MKKPMEQHKPVFIVEDDLFYAELLRAELEQLGFRNLRILHSGQECLNAMEAGPSLIFLDHRLPGKIGTDVLQRIKRHDPEVPVVLLSGQQDYRVAVEALQFGAVDYIVKGPEDMQNVRSVIQRLESFEVFRKRMQRKQVRGSFFRSKVDTGVSGAA